MIYDQAVSYIKSVSWKGSMPGLSRIKMLLSSMGDPQEKLNIIHVTGTNGKGSVCAFLNSVLVSSGYKVGLFASPSLGRYNDMIFLNGENISDEEFCTSVANVKVFAEKIPEKPTEFEMMTAVALEYFTREKCQVVILEAGMGGGKDATNITDTPILSVITAIDADHVKELGGSILSIAEEKAGIIKKGCPVVYYGGNPKADRVIERKAKEFQCDIGKISTSGLHKVLVSQTGCVFDYKEAKGLEIPFSGEYQMMNCALALEGINKIKKIYPGINITTVREGLRRAKWKGRFEVINKDPVFIIDGGHNPHGIKAFVDSYKNLFGDKKSVIIMGVMADKDVGSMVGMLLEIASIFLTVRPDNPRAMAPEVLARIVEKGNIPAVSFEDVGEAVKYGFALAKDNSSPICGVGSLYMYGQVIRGFEKLKEGRMV